jgi:hypothetical protein
MTSASALIIYLAISAYAILGLWLVAGCPKRKAREDARTLRRPGTDN